VPRPPPSSLSTFAHDLVERAKRIDEGTRRRAVVVFASAITLLVAIIGLVSLFKGSGHDATNAATTASAAPEVTAAAPPPPSAEAAAPVEGPAPEPTPPPEVTAAPTAVETAAPAEAPSADDTDEPEASAPNATAAPTVKRQPRPKGTATGTASKKKKPNFGY
jgi:hypothetical protein